MAELGGALVDGKGEGVVAAGPCGKGPVDGQQIVAQHTSGQMLAGPVERHRRFASRSPRARAGIRHVDEIGHAGENGFRCCVWCCVRCCVRGAFWGADLRAGSADIPGVGHRLEQARDRQIGERPLQDEFDILIEVIIDVFCWLDHEGAFEVAALRDGEARAGDGIQRGIHHDPEAQHRREDDFGAVIVDQVVRIAVAVLCPCHGQRHAHDEQQHAHQYPAQPKPGIASHDALPRR